MGGGVTRAATEKSEEAVGVGVGVGNTFSTLSCLYDCSQFATTQWHLFAAGSAGEGEMKVGAGSRGRRQKDSEHLALTLSAQGCGSVRVCKPREREREPERKRVTPRDACVGGGIHARARTGLCQARRRLLVV